jgi:hypothetical protein
MILIFHCTKQQQVEFPQHNLQLLSEQFELKELFCILFAGTEPENFVEGGENITIDKKKNNNYIHIQKRSYEGSYYFSTQLIKLFCIYFFSCHVLDCK